MDLAAKFGYRLMWEIHQKMPDACVRLIEEDKLRTPQDSDRFVFDEELEKFVREKIEVAMQNAPKAGLYDARFRLAACRLMVLANPVLTARNAKKGEDKFVVFARYVPIGTTWTVKHKALTGDYAFVIPVQ